MTTTDEKIAAQAAKSVEELSAEQAYAVGAAVGSLLRDGMPTRNALDATATIAEFVKKGVAAQRAVDAIIAAENQKNSPPPDAT